MPVPETHEQAVVDLAKSWYLPAWAVRSLKRYLRRAINAAVAAELDRQADALENWTRYHGLGFPDRGACARCEAWRRVVSVLRARAAELRKAE